MKKDSISMPLIASLYSCKEEYGDLEDGLYAKLKQTKEIS
jgi:hypothetical protein